MLDTVPAATESPTDKASQPNVRLAVPADEEALWDILCVAHADNGIFSISEEKVREFIRLGTRGQGGLIGIIDGDGEIAATVGLILEQYWYSDDWTLGERWNYVREKYRKTNYANDLINFSIWSADKIGLSLNMGIMSTKRMDAKIRLYRRKLQMIGAFFIHGLDRTSGPLGSEDFKNHRK